MGDEHEEELSDYFGDYPNGSYWSAKRRDDARPARPRTPRRIAEVRTPANPYPLRMMTEYSCEFALWGVAMEDPPTASDVEEPRHLEDRLPLPASLRERLLAWAADFLRYDAGDRTVDMFDHDERGFLMSREVQRSLGDLYSVEFYFTMAGDHQHALRASVSDDPLPGWTCH